MWKKVFRANFDDAYHSNRLYALVDSFFFFFYSQPAFDCMAMVEPRETLISFLFFLLGGRGGVDSVLFSRY